MKTAEEIIKEIYDYRTLKGAWDDFKALYPVKYLAILSAMEEYRQQPSASQPMSAEQYSSGAIHSLGEFPTTKSMSAEQVELSQLLHDCNQILSAYAMDETWSEWDESVRQRIIQMQHNLSAPTVKAEGWVSVEEFWNNLTDEQRLQLRSCKGCGSLDTSCQCWNDE